MKLSRLAVLASAAALVVAGSASASTWVSSGTSTASGALDGQAIITITGNTMVVKLSDLLTDTKNAGEEVSGVEIILANPEKSVSLTGESGQVINITGKGSTGYTTSNAAIGHWGVTEVGSDIFLATAGTGAAGGKPYDLIIGQQAKYLDANASITQHSPSIEGTGTFTINLTPTSNTAPAPTILGVKIEFGTGPDNLVNATCSALCTLGGQVNASVPEPRTWGLMIVGFMGVGGLIRAERRRKALNAA